MKTNEFLTTGFRRTRALAQFSSMLFLAIPFCQSKGASCKVLADSTETRSGRSVLSEDITTRSGVFWGTGGVSHRSTRSMRQFAQDTQASLKELWDCPFVAEEAAKGAPASKYTLHNSSSRGDDCV